jgi:Conserved TM helix
MRLFGTRVYRVPALLRDTFPNRLFWVLSRLLGYVMGNGRSHGGPITRGEGVGMLAIDIQGGLSDAWARIVVFAPKLLGFLVILIIGYFVAKILAKVVDGVLEKIGFDRWVERGALKQALERSKFDASDILATIVFWTAFLLVLQLAFGVFGSNPVSDLIAGLVAYLPRLFVAVIILVIAAAVAKVVTELLSATLGAVSGGDWIAQAAGLAVLVVGIFAALNQLQITPAIQGDDVDL